MVKNIPIINTLTMKYFLSQIRFLCRIRGMRLLTFSINLVLIFGVRARAAERLTFDQFIKSVEEKNLTLKIDTARSQAATENAKGLSIPAPMVGYMRMTDQSGGVANGIEVTQTIPFPTKISNGRKAREFESQAQQEILVGNKSETLAQARVIYFNLWASQQKKLIWLDKKSVLQDHIKLSRASVRSDTLARIHLLKAESDLDFLENEILSIDQEIQEREVEVAQVMNIDADSFHPSLEEPPEVQIPTQKLEGVAPQLESLRLTLESFKAQESEAKAGWFPDLNLRYKQLGSTDMMPGYSEVMIGVSLPFVFPWETSAQSNRAASLRMQSEFEYQKESRKIVAEKSVLAMKMASLKKQIDNINQKLLPRAEKRMRIVHTLAPRDMETLQDHRETMEAFPELKLKALELRIQYEAAVAEILKYQRGIK